MSATDNLFLFEKTLTNDVDQNGNQDEQSFGLTTSKQEPARCQPTASTKPDPGENKNDPKETCNHQIDILFSPQKQKDLKGTVGYIESLTFIVFTCLTFGKSFFIAWDFFLLHAISPG